MCFRLYSTGPRRGRSPRPNAARARAPARRTKRFVRGFSPAPVEADFFVLREVSVAARQSIDIDDHRRFVLFAKKMNDDERFARRTSRPGAVVARVDTSGAPS